MSKKLAVRLPLLAAVVLGAWLWRSSFFPQERELVVLLPPVKAEVAGAEVQVYSAGGELLKREQWFFQDPRQATSVLRLTLSLKGGHYLVRGFVRERAGPERASSRELDLGDEKTVNVELR